MTDELSSKNVTGNLPARVFEARGVSPAYISHLPSETADVSATAAETVLSAIPPDDAGASTADRYDWQAAMATADGLSLYLSALDGSLLQDDVDVRIVCEHHEDWTVIRGDEAELVSAKHRDPSNGVFTTLNQLADSGGLAHLFCRWYVLSELPSCRLVTTAGLGAGPPQGLEKAAAFLRDQRLAGETIAASGEHEQIVREFTQSLLQYADPLPDSWPPRGTGRAAALRMDHFSQVGRFLSFLTIEHGKPGRQHINYAAPAMYCAPVLTGLGRSGISPVPPWEAVLGLFRVRMRAHGSVPWGALPQVLSYRPGTVAASVVERDLAVRIVTMADIDMALRAGLADPAGYRPLPPLTRLTRIAVKMAAGGCSDNSIERAEQLRLDYQRYWRTRVSGDPTARALQAKLRRSLLRISDQATAAVNSTTETARGAALWQELQTRVDHMPADPWPDDLDADLRLGGICDLANQCKVWFSRGFDVGAELERLRALGEAAS